MSPSFITQQRLAAQNLTVQCFSSPTELVGWMGAMQAQDYEMSKWAVATRLPNMSENLVENALNQGDILRTHVLRPTWHLVASTDIRWMLQLTAPHLEKILGGYLKSMGLDFDICRKSNVIIERMLHQQPNLTRDVLMSALTQHNISTNENRSAHLMFYAEWTGLVCSGVRKGKQITYDLLDNRAPLMPLLHRDEALEKLARRYFQSHSPATLKDFAWWSGLPMGDVRKAVECIKADLEVFEIDKTAYYNLPSNVSLSNGNELFILSAFDEYLVSYVNRNAALPPQYAAQTTTFNGIFKPIIVHQGKVIGLWKRTVKPKYIEVELLPFEPLTETLETQIKACFDAYKKYMGVDDLRFV